MPNSDPRPARKAMAALLGFLARGPATDVSRDGVGLPEQRALMRSDGVRRRIDARLLAAALERGLLKSAKSAGPAGESVSVYTLTPEGRCAVKRWLADPDSAFQDQHRTLTLRPDPDHGTLKINDAESPLAMLARIKGRGGAPFLEPAQLQAGERLRIDFTRGQMQPSLGQRWEPVTSGRQSGASGGAAELSEAALSARMRVDAAIGAVGPELSGVLLDVCCFLKGLSQVEHERQWPVRSAKLMLRTALTALARHYAAPRRAVRPQPVPPPHAP